MTVETRSSMKRSCVTRISPPSNSARLSSSTSSVGMSRSLVGSSSTSRSAGSRIRRAIRMRACSPPESRPTGTSSCSGRNRKRLAQECDVHAPALPDDRVALGRQRPAQALRRVEAAALLLEAHDAQALGVLDVPGVGRQPAGEHVEQRRLAAAVGPDQADARARRDDQIEAAHQSPASERLGHSACDDQPARAALRGGEVDPRGGRETARAALRQLVDEPLRLLDAPLGLGRARLGAAAEPLDLPPHGVGQRLLVGRLPAQEVVAARQELAVAALRLEQAGGVGAVQLEHAGGHVLQEVAIVADDQAGPRALGQQALQPEDAVDVEVVGRLVHQQNVGRGRQLARDRQALAPASRQRVDLRSSVGEAGPAKSLRQAARSVVFVDVGEGRQHHVGDGPGSGKDRVLRDVAHADAAAERAGAAVGRLETDENLEEGGLARAVGADETRLVAFEQSERQIVEERPGPEGLAHRLTAQQERAGHPTLLLLRLLLFLPHPLALRHALTPSRRFADRCPSMIISIDRRSDEEEECFATIRTVRSGRPGPCRYARRAARGPGPC